jgi:hypothetical protein
MPIASRIVDEHGIVLTRAWDGLADGHLRDHHASLVGHDAFRPSLDQLFDLQSVTTVEVTTDALRELARRNPFGAGSRRAFVVAPEGALSFGLTRVYQGHAADDPDRIVVQFDDMESALAWLERDPIVLRWMPGP